MSGRDSAGPLPISVAAGVDTRTPNRHTDRSLPAVLFGRVPTVGTTPVGDASDDSLRLFLHTTRFTVAPLGMNHTDLERLATTREAVGAELHRRVVLGHSPVTVLAPTIVVSESATTPDTGGTSAGPESPSSAPVRKGAAAARPRYGGRQFKLSAEERQLVEAWERREELELATYYDLAEHLVRRGILGWSHRRVERLINRVAKKRRRDALRETRRT